MGYDNIFERHVWDSSVCNRTENKFEGGYCYSAIALANGNYSICDSIRDKKLVGWCRNLSGGVDGSSICDGVGDTLDKVACITGVAVGFNRPDLCASIYDEMGFRGFSYGCYQRVAEVQRNISVCGMIGDDYDRDFCYLGVSESTGDISICDIISFEDKKSDCYAWFAKERGDPSLCNKTETLEQTLEEFEKMEKCYLEVAKATGNSSVCRRMWIGYLRELCYNSTQG